MTAPVTFAKPNITLDRRAPSRHDSTLLSTHAAVLALSLPQQEPLRDLRLLVLPKWGNTPALKDLPMKKYMVAVVGLALAANVGSTPVQAKGAIKGAVVGATAGHFVGHGHAKSGAVAGAMIGHHHAAMKARRGK